MRNPRHYRCARCIYPAAAALACLTALIMAQGPAAIQNAAGLRLFVSAENIQPMLCIVLPGHQDTDHAINILFPEHVTANKHGSNDGEHLYLFQPGQQGDKPAWRGLGRSLQYERDLTGNVHLLARATLEDDGIRFHYQFVNRSSVAYDMIYAVTDPRLISIFHDVRLERTYVHHPDGFDLLASDAPGRLTMPLDKWLPCRYMASFTWPVPAQRIEHRSDGITYYTKSRAVDEPLIATVSTDHKWIVASFTRTVGNVWSNPELTCQHVDPQTALGPGQQATLEVKILIFQGSLDEVLQKVRTQRSSLK